MKLFFYGLYFISGWFYSTAQTVDYHTGVKPILQMHCMPCHTKTSIGAMPLVTYGQTKAYGKMIAYVTGNRLMPPWKADDNFSQLKNHNSLTAVELAAIKSWVDSGMPEGKIPAETISAVADKEKGVAKPDEVIAMEQPFTIADDYTEHSQVFVIPFKGKKEELVDAVEFVPGNAKLVKSCTVSIDTGQTAIRYDGNDVNYGYASATGVGFIPYQFAWYQWTAGEKPGFYSLPYAKAVPAGGRFLLHITYMATKSVQKDSSYLKLQFLKKAEKPNLIRSEVLLDTTSITNGPFNIKSGDKRKFYAVRQLQQPVEIHGIMPMGQTALSSWEIYAVDSLTGQRLNLLKIPHWDAHWKKKYVLETPVRLSAGSKIFGVAYYNNSDDNPNLLILPPKKINWGEGRRDELFAVQFDVVYVKREDE